MSFGKSASGSARAVRIDLESFSVAACLRDRFGKIVAANARACALWRQPDANDFSGFASVRRMNGLEWEGWPPLEEGSAHPMQPCHLVGTDRDGSEVEYIAYPSLLVSTAGEQVRLLEILVPLSRETTPLQLIHGLTNALGVILGNVELAKEEMSPEYLDEIRNAALGARNLVRQPDPERKGLAQVAARQTPARLMCIDDDEGFLLLAGRALQRLGHQARTYSSPDEALLEYARRPGDWDLVVIDNNLLGREGLEIAGEFLCEDPLARICIASGAVDDVLRRRAETAGVYRVILKPGTMSEFADMIQGILADLTPPPNPP